MSRDIQLDRRLLSAPIRTADASAIGLRSAQDVLICVFDAIGRWQDRAAERHQLGSLDDRMLADIGVSHAAACNEAGKPFWRC